MNSPCRIEISTDRDSPLWDAFVAAVPGGHYTQTSSWARLKASMGWQVIRIVAWRNEAIQAGVQLLMRSLPIWGRVGYVSHGPLLLDQDFELADRILDKLFEQVKSRRILLAAIHPPPNGHWLEERLRERGALPGAAVQFVSATVIVDVSLPPDDLLSQMRRKTRQHIRRGLRAGISVREGGKSDLGEFYRQMVRIGQRRGFTPYEERYFSALWEQLHPRKMARLFVAEKDGEPVCSLLALPFGDTVALHRMGWTGRLGRLRPVEMMVWEVFQWAKANGYRYCDFEGIDRAIAEEIVENGHHPGPDQDSITFLKVGFGGQVKLLPGVQDYLYSTLLRRAYQLVFSRLYSSQFMRRFKERFSIWLNARRL